MLLLARTGCCLLFLLFLKPHTIAQTAFQKNTVYGELGGHGLFLSLNYERQLGDRPGLGLRAGVGYFSEHGMRVSIPVGLVYLLPLCSDRSLLEPAAGVTLTPAEEMKPAKLRQPGAPDKTVLLNFTTGLSYRRHTRYGLFYRAGVSAVINRYRVFPVPGLAAGWRL